MTSVVPAKLNRRRYTRVSTRQMRSCFLAHGIGPANGWVVDISLGGVFLRTSWPLPVGEKLAIELPRGGKATPVCVRGRVVTSSPSRAGMGVRFDELDPKTLGALRELISGLAPAGTRLELPPEDNEITAVAGTPMPAPSAPSGVMPKLTAAQPMPIAPRPSAPPPAASEVSDAAENQRLKMHARGLLMQIGDLQSQVASRDREIQSLREAIAHLQASNAQLRR